MGCEGAETFPSQPCTRCRVTSGGQKASLAEGRGDGVVGKLPRMVTGDVRGHRAGHWQERGEVRGELQVSTQSGRGTQGDWLPTVGWEL